MNSAKMTLRLIDRDGLHCHYCKVLLKFTDAIGLRNRGTVEHIIPSSKGGTDDMSNLVLACVPCNTKKGNKIL